MGSGLAAGGACLFAAHREQMKLNSVSECVRQKFYREVLPLRRVDDLLFCHARCLSPEVRHLLDELQDEAFYGGRLKLENVGGNEAFGFSLQSVCGMIKVRQAPKFIRSLKAGSFTKRWALIQ